MVNRNSTFLNLAEPSLVYVVHPCNLIGDKNFAGGEILIFKSEYTIRHPVAQLFPYLYTPFIYPNAKFWKLDSYPSSRFN